MRVLESLAFAGLAAASLQHREILHQVRNQEAYVHHTDLRSRHHNSEPCAILAHIYEYAVPDKNKYSLVDVPPSLGIECLRSVPLDKENDIKLINYLRPYVGLQSTIEQLADPPEGYLLPGVDILGGLDEIQQKLGNDQYDSQYEVMTDLRNIFVAAADNHFDYPPALLNAFSYFRPGLDFVSVSMDGLKLPAIYAAIDVNNGNNGRLDYRPSAVKHVDGVPVVDFLQEDAYHHTMNYQDPDAQYNSLFGTIPAFAAGKVGAALGSEFAVPDNHTITFYNGTSTIVNNQMVFFPGKDLSGIISGLDFHKRFEISSKKAAQADEDEDTALPDKDSIAARDDVIAAFVLGYPEPVIKHSQNSIAGYFPSEKGYEDVAVLSIINFQPNFANIIDMFFFNETQYVLEAKEVITSFFEAAKKDGRDKLVIDLSANGGGSILLTNEVYRLLFPDGEFLTFERYRDSIALSTAVGTRYDIFNQYFIGEGYPIDSHNDEIHTEENFLGPYVAGGQNTSAAFMANPAKPYAYDTWINGFEPDDTAAIPKAIFDPKNIVIITDGTCASACGILTGLLTRNHGIRTIALGGRPDHLPMQAMGGVKGTIVHPMSRIRQGFAAILKGVDKNDALKMKMIDDHRSHMPDPHANPPLRPLPWGQLGGRMNGRSGYTHDDLDGLPVHFKYEAANCRLFYTQRMLADVSEPWRRAADIAWRGARCVRGSTFNKDTTISGESLGYDPRSKSRARAIKGPGQIG